MNRFARRLAAVAWPAFLGAVALEMAVFAFVDPGNLHMLGSLDTLGWSDTTVYSAAFLVFWLTTAVACALSLLLQQAADEVNLPHST